MLKVSAGPASLGGLKAPALAILFEQLTEAPDLGALDATLAAQVRRVTASRDFRGARDEVATLLGGDAVERVLLVGLGKVTDRRAALRRGAAIAARRAHQQGFGRLTVAAGAVAGDDVEALALGAISGAWEMKEYQTPPPEDERRAPLTEVSIVGENGSVRDGIARATAIGEGQTLARRLAMLPGNVCTPDYLAETARDIAKRHGMKVTVLGRAEMEREGMGSLLAVAQGTPQEPRLIALEYRHGGNKPVIALVGKGLCFDSGGISIKPAQGMEMMKFDMCGAAGVLGALEAIARLNLPVNVVGLVGSTTNMPSGTAVKPGDVVKASNGKQIEIINTDAEGRLVLADVLVYAKRFSPAVVLDAATLTGAVVIALGNIATGVMGNDERLVQEVLDAGKRAAEPGWPLPLWDEFKPLIKSDIGDVKNSGGRPAGTITAGLFLKEFVDGFQWAHLDIAGTAYSETDLGTIPAGATGVPVGTFVEFVRGRAG